VFYAWEWRSDVGFADDLPRLGALGCGASDDVVSALYARDGHGPLGAD